MIKVAVLIEGVLQEDVENNTIKLSTLPQQVLRNSQVHTLTQKFHKVLVNRFGWYYKCIVVTRTKPLPPFFIELFSVDETTGEVINEEIKQVPRPSDVPIITTSMTYQQQYPA